MSEDKKLKTYCVFSQEVQYKIVEAASEEEAVEIARSSEWDGYDCNKDEVWAEEQ
tara:strand:- start:657 stop:821 length:165 start_codon:yes stop_codon:yes gene_type:complete